MNSDCFPRPRTKHPAVRGSGKSAQAARSSLLPGLNSEEIGAPAGTSRCWSHRAKRGASGGGL
eukprot:12985858-Alexandrium_andersonii.AAC.1